MDIPWSIVYSSGTLTCDDSQFGLGRTCMDARSAMVELSRHGGGEAVLGLRRPCLGIGCSRPSCLEEHTVKAWYEVENEDGAEEDDRNDYEKTLDWCERVLAPSFAGIPHPQSSCLRRAPGHTATRLVTYDVPDTNAVLEFLSRHGYRVGALQCTGCFQVGRPLIDYEDTQAEFRLPLWPGSHQQPGSPYEYDPGMASSSGGPSSAKRPRQMIAQASGTGSCAGIQSLTVEKLDRNGNVDGVPLATILTTVTPNLRHLRIKQSYSSWSNQMLSDVAHSPASKSITLLDWGWQGPMFDTWAATQPFIHGRGLEALGIHGDSSSGSDQLMLKAPSELAGTLRYLKCSQEQLCSGPGDYWRMSIEEIEAAMAPVKFRMG